MTAVKIALDMYGRHCAVIHLGPGSRHSELMGSLVFAQCRLPRGVMRRTPADLCKEVAAALSAYAEDTHQSQLARLRALTGPGGYVRGWHCPQDHGGNTRGVLDTGAVHCQGCGYCEHPSEAVGRLESDVAS